MTRTDQPPEFVDVVETASEADALSIPPLVIVDRLASFLPGSGPISVKRIRAGHSNATFLVERGPRSWVLRRPPRPPVPPTAHDVEREFRLLSALRDAQVRAPKPELLCDDIDVIGAPFYLMEKVDGVVIRDQVPRELDSADALGAVGEELVDALVELHAVDCTTGPLAQVGRRTGYLERQVRRWAEMWDRNATRDVPAIGRVRRVLAERMPASCDVSVVHGDYKLDNVMISPGPPPRAVAILDWEMATLGDPLADLGYLSAMWIDPGEPANQLLGLSAATAHSGFPVRSELVEKYAERSGRNVSNLAWYRTLALWKLAILLEGSYNRFISGATDDQFFARLREGVPALAGLAEGSAAEI